MTRLISLKIILTFSFCLFLSKSFAKDYSEQKVYNCLYKLTIGIEVDAYNNCYQTGILIKNKDNFYILTSLHGFLKASTGTGIDAKIINIESKYGDKINPIDLDEIKINFEYDQAIIKVNKNLSNYLYLATTENIKSIKLSSKLKSYGVLPNNSPTFFDVTVTEIGKTGRYEMFRDCQMPSENSEGFSFSGASEVGFSGGPIIHNDSIVIGSITFRVGATGYYNYATTVQLLTSFKSISFYRDNRCFINLLEFHYDYHLSNIAAKNLNKLLIEIKNNTIPKSPCNLQDFDIIHDSIGTLPRLNKRKHKFKYSKINPIRSLIQAYAVAYHTGNNSDLKSQLRHLYNTPFINNNYIKFNQKYYSEYPEFWVSISIARITNKIFEYNKKDNRNKKEQYKINQMIDDLEDKLDERPKDKNVVSEYEVSIWKRCGLNIYDELNFLYSLNSKYSSCNKIYSNVLNFYNCNKKENALYEILNLIKSGCECYIKDADIRKTAIDIVEDHLPITNECHPINTNTISTSHETQESVLIDRCYKELNLEYRSDSTQNKFTSLPLIFNSNSIPLEFQNLHKKDKKIYSDFMEALYSGDVKRLLELSHMAPGGSKLKVDDEIDFLNQFPSIKKFLHLLQLIDKYKGTTDIDRRSQNKTLKKRYLEYETLLNIYSNKTTPNLIRESNSYILISKYLIEDFQKLANCQMLLNKQIKPISEHKDSLIAQKTYFEGMVDSIVLNECICFYKQFDSKLKKAQKSITKIDITLNKELPIDSIVQNILSKLNLLKSQYQSITKIPNVEFSAGEFSYKGFEIQIDYGMHNKEYAKIIHNNYPLGVYNHEGTQVLMSLIGEFLEDIERDYYETGYFEGNASIFFGGTADATPFRKKLNYNNEFGILDNNSIRNFNNLKNYTFKSCLQNINLNNIALAYLRAYQSYYELCKQAYLKQLRFISLNPDMIYAQEYKRRGPEYRKVSIVIKFTFSNKFLETPVVVEPLSF